MKFVQRTYNGIFKFLDLCSALMFCLLVFVYLSLIVTRYISHIPIIWAEELSGVLFVFIILLGSSKAFLDDQHIRVGLLKYNSLNLLANLLSIAVIGVLSLFTFQLIIALPGNPLATLRFMTRTHLYIVMLVSLWLMIAALIPNLTRPMRKLDLD